MNNSRDVKTASSPWQTILHMELYVNQATVLSHNASLLAVYTALKRNLYIYTHVNWNKQTNRKRKKKRHVQFKTHSKSSVQYSSLAQQTCAATVATWFPAASLQQAHFMMTQCNGSGSQCEISLGNAQLWNRLGPILRTHKFSASPIFHLYSNNNCNNNNSSNRPQTTQEYIPTPTV